MSLDKAIKYGKEPRNPYRGSKAFDLSCRNLRCPYCLRNKTYNADKKHQKSLQDFKDLDS